MDESCARRVGATNNTGSRQAKAFGKDLTCMDALIPRSHGREGAVLGYFFPEKSNSPYDVHGRTNVVGAWMRKND